MSWSIKASGKHADVVHLVNSDVYIPPGIKSTIADIANEPQSASHPHDCLRVEGYGHSGGGFGGITKLEVERYTAAKAEAAPAEAAAPAPASS